MQTVQDTDVFIQPKIITLTSNALLSEIWNDLTTNLWKFDAEGIDFVSLDQVQRWVQDKQLTLAVVVQNKKPKVIGTFRKVSTGNSRQLVSIFNQLDISDFILPSLTGTLEPFSQFKYTNGNLSSSVHTPLKFELGRDFFNYGDCWFVSKEYRNSNVGHTVTYAEPDFYKQFKEVLPNTRFVVGFCVSINSKGKELIKGHFGYCQHEARMFGKAFGKKLDHIKFDSWRRKNLYFENSMVAYYIGVAEYKHNQTMARI